MTNLDTTPQSDKPNLIRLALVRQGYVPVPVSGKAPTLKGWQKRETPGAEEIEDWDKHFPDASNTGVLTKLTPSLDVDVSLAAAAWAVWELVQESFAPEGMVLCRVGQPPKLCVPFRADEPFAKVIVDLQDPEGKAQRLEFLGDGQQIVVHGRHPTAGRDYQWMGPNQTPIWQVRHQDLPPIDAERAAALINACADLLVRGFGFKRLGLRRLAKNGPDVMAGPADWSVNFLDHDQLASFAMKLLRSGMRPNPAANMLRQQVQALQGVDEERRQRRLDEIADLVASADRKIEAEERAEPELKPETPTPLAGLPLSAWDGVPVPPQEWTVPERIPKRQVCLFSGEGATGKSTIALQLACATVLGADWLGAVPEKGPVIFLDAEDEPGVLHRRTADMCAHYGCSFSDLERAGLVLISRVGEDAVLAKNGHSLITPTPLFHELHRQVVAVRPRLIVLASLANVWSGNEIERTQVQQCVSLFSRLALAADGSLLLLAHPSLTGINTKTGLSGSTQWHNAVRARIYLTSPENQDGERIGDVRLLEFKKNQYGPVSAAITLRWKLGLFLPEGDGSQGFQKLARQNLLDLVFQQCLAKSLKQQVNVAPAPNARNFAPTIFAADQLAIAERASKAELHQAMQRLYASGKIQTVQYGKPAKPAFRIDFAEPFLG